MDCAPKIVSPFLENFVSNANECVYFKLVKNARDLEEDIEKDSFHPDYSHQIFGDKESVVGYRDLKIRLFYSASRLIRYVNVSFAEAMPPEKSEGVEPDDIMMILKEKLGGTFLTNIDTFASALEKEGNFTPFGDLLHVFTIDENQLGKDGSETVVKRVFEVYKSETSDRGFRNYHENMQTFLLWFIDAASYIDIEDDKWDYFVIYEKVVSNGVANGTSYNGNIVSYHFVGYTTVYCYYAYPEHMRPRISQVLILPPLQKRGIGVKMLESIYNYYKAKSDVVDITVEDPSDDFRRLRDFVDARNCLKLNSYRREMLMNGWNAEMAVEAREKLRLNKKQARRIYEILKLRTIDKSKQDVYRQYRLEIKNRLNAPMATKSKRAFIDAKDDRSVKEMRVEELTLLYNQLEEEYQRVIERLAGNGE